MIIDQLPNHVLLQILQYLPFNERVRIARVNRRLKMLSETIISQTKSLDLTAPIFRRITTESMAKIIDLCSGNLENVIFNDYEWQTEREEQNTIFERVKFYDDCGNRGKFLAFILLICPNLKHLDLREVITLKDIGIMRLHSLKSLDLVYYDDITNRFLRKISSSFPQLEQLEVVTYSGAMKSRGLKYLENLKHLRFFKIIYKNRGSGNLDASAMELIRCKCLHSVQFRHCLNPETVHAFTRHCSQLRQLIVKNIHGIDSPDLASSFVLSLVDFVQKDLSIMIDAAGSKVWKCPQVESALREINRSGRRLSIDISPTVVSDVDDEWGVKVIFILCLCLNFMMFLPVLISLYLKH